MSIFGVQLYCHFEQINHVDQFRKFCMKCFPFPNQVFISFDMFASSYGIYEVLMVKSHQNDAFPYNFKDLFRLFIFGLNPWPWLDLEFWFPSFRRSHYQRPTHIINKLFFMSQRVNFFIIIFLGQIYSAAGFGQECHSVTDHNIICPCVEYQTHCHVISVTFF